MTPRSVSSATPKGAWIIVLLLFLYMVVNYADKIVVGLAGVPIIAELTLTPRDFGLLGSSFFFLYSVSAVIFGFVINRVPTRWVLLFLSLVWGLSQFPIVLHPAFTTLLLCRVVLGAGEGPAFAVALHAIFKWFPDHERALPTAILAQGASAGVIVAVPALNWIIVHHSWHLAFGALGIVSLGWAAVWLVLGREGPLDTTPTSSPAPADVVARVSQVSYARLLLSPTFVGVCIAGLGAYTSLSLGVAWFTPFVIKGLGFSQERAGWISVLPWGWGAICSIVTGVASQAMLRNGYTTRGARGVFAAVPLILGAGLLVLMAVVSAPMVKLALLVTQFGVCGSTFVLGPTMLGEFTPPARRGAVIAIYQAVIGLAGVVAPAVMGNVLDGAATPLEGYLRGYELVAVVLALAGVAGLALLRPGEERERMLRASGGSRSPLASTDEA